MGVKLKCCLAGTTRYFITFYVSNQAWGVNLNTHGSNATIRAECHCQNLAGTARKGSSPGLLGLTSVKLEGIMVKVGVVTAPGLTIIFLRVIWR